MAAEPWERLRHGGKGPDMTSCLRILPTAGRRRAARQGRILPVALSVALVLGSLAALMAATAPTAGAAPLPGFQEQIVFSGLTNPTVVRFVDDGRVFVAEKGGRIKVFDSLADTTPTTFADLSTNVHNFWDRGMLGMTLAPNFPADPSVYVLYTHDAAIGGTAPRWGTPGVYSDPCPTPPGATADGCVVSGRLSRLQAAGSVMTGSEQVLVEDWCQQYPSHSVGTVEFGADGMLYASGGDGASFNFVDYGQDGSPVNPCGDPGGAAPAPPTAEGGALRSQDLRSGGDPVSLDGAVIRVDPATGAAAPGNPMIGAADPNTRRIIAYGQRNPFRFTVRPGTNQLWLGDVGWNDWEEINHIPNPTDSVVENFGWPCYEGVGRQAGYDGANLNICESLYGAPGAVTPPYFAYHHNSRVVPNESCPTGSSSIAGLDFQFAASDSSYPAEYDDALFFADYSRDCIWVMPKGADGQPAPGQVRTFVAGAANPVNLEIGPDGNLYYADFDGGTIRRISYANQAPNAVASASPTSGSAPLTVTFNGSQSSDPDGGTLAYAWDLDGDGAFDDAATAQASWTYTAAGAYTATLRVTDGQGLSDTDAVTVTVGNTPPTATINTPTAGTTWKVGDQISFSGSATDPQDGTLPASALTWELVQQHCPSNCHTHPVQTFAGVASGSFTAPDHEYPSYLELRLTARDSGGLSHTVTRRLDPRTVALTFATNPGSLRLVVNGVQGTAAFTRTVIIGSSNTVSAITPQTKGKQTYAFTSWSDGGAQTHTIVAPASATTYTARYRR
jgi:glucose/arabinose dehydrogenase